jgi:hypothetical protein
MLTMRGAVQGERDGYSTVLGSGALLILRRVLTAGGFLAATAASLWLILRPRRGALIAFVCWSAIATCAVTGFLSGSRAVFFYAVVPLGATGWILLGRRFNNAIRWAWAGTALALLLSVWGAMSAMRGGDIRAFEYLAREEELSFQSHARGAFDIYSQMSVVVQGFPEVFPYQHGRSLLPLVFGWVPRQLWPDKPYPFSNYMSFLNGDDLESRTASIAVGIPGEGYGNFGVFGAFLWAALMGWACRRGDDYIATFHPSHPLRLQIGGMAAIWAAMIVRGGVPEMFYMGLGAILLPWLLAKYLFGNASRNAQEREAGAWRLQSAGWTLDPDLRGRTR